MAFNPITFIRIAGLFPGFAGLFGTALLSVTARLGLVTVANRLATVMLRTAGLILNRSPVTLGIPLPQGPAARLVTGPPTFLNPLGFPGINSFLSGFAYEDNEDLADGWLSFFGELLLSDVPVIETSVGKAIDALGRGDFITFGDEAAQALSNDIGLADLAAFFNGIAQVERDFQELGLPTLSAAPWVFGGITGAVIWLDATFTSVGSAVGAFFQPPGPTSEGRPPDIKRPPPPGPPGVPLDPGLRRGLPTTEAQVREVGKAFGRFRKFVPDLARIIAILKRERA